jgi:hypothetical protein
MHATIEACLVFTGFITVRTTAVNDRKGTWSNTPAFVAPEFRNQYE